MARSRNIWQPKYKVPRRYQYRRRSAWRRYYWLLRLAAPFVALLAVWIFQEFDNLPNLLPSRTAYVSAKASDTLGGRASVIDGDTIEIGDKRIRFNGVDAPESAQNCQSASGKKIRCGAVSAKALAAYLLESSPTRCSIIGRDQYDRLVGDCFRADGRSASEWLVRNGHALDWSKYSGGKYDVFERAAQAEQIGLWSGPFQKPWEWRAAQGQAELRIDEKLTPAVSRPMGLASNGGCRIKGNVASDGERIYHVPGQEFYRTTVVSASKGERWFCSEAQARTAGWRRAKR